jgi:hypothetical protein
VAISLLCTSDPDILAGRAALVVGHPGHELRVFGWMQECRPRVYVMTDGSGRHGISRVVSTARLIDGLGAQRGEVFGTFSDAEFYSAIREQRIAFFLDLLDQLASSFVENGITLVAGDAIEGYNPTHDLCRAMVNGAVQIVQGTTGTTIRNHEFCLTEWERSCPEHHDDRCSHLQLDAISFRQKIDAATGYSELQGEVQKAIEARGEEHFRIECLKKVDSSPLEWASSNKPFYETWGERQVACGEYASVIRRAEHIRPIAAAIREYADQGMIGKYRVA